MHRVKEKMGVYQRERTGIVHTALETHKKSKYLCILSNNGPKGEADMNHPLTKDKDYSVWLKELKYKVRLVPIKAAVKVNSELLQFYWELGADIVEKQATAKWGDGFLSNLSHDLMAEFPDMKGFSKRNLELIRKWYCFWSVQDEIAKQLATQIPWWHNVIIITKTKNTDEALFYVQKTILNTWSRSVLTHHIGSYLFKREGKGITNFKATLPETQSDLARETLKDVHKPIGVSEYIITKTLPDEFRSSLPSIEEIEAELGKVEEL
jgi:predicted nuclease of restriction endonuclease-like (RecB) superfamily